MLGLVPFSCPTKQMPYVWLAAEVGTQRRRSPCLLDFPVQPRRRCRFDGMWVPKKRQSAQNVIVIGIDSLCYKRPLKNVWCFSAPTCSRS